ncbi:PP2C family protein-serine/threonine phosphatase [Selenihalanaerobacter shriftii]|uniref:Serine/threonine protein phosphatase PrpC n=1 Tax=Selenihalanaerobacter shriftii TaxID=142842 RepID=A0A1T4Q1M2_9FIRM|nr:protein phosphatase 2C domain-containing protein [Selenihalanaerobacter shriftii]SJZ97604.1 Serine/threonine protein phosphatase PrpC [Selenihalanaerobacter shriftii]
MLRTIVQFPNIVFWFIGLLLIIKYLLKANFKNKKCKSEILIGNAQTIGNRKEQEDAFATIKDDNRILAVLADGMGGFALGKEASDLVVQTFLEAFSRNYNINSINKFLINTAYISNSKVLELAENRHVGTTLVTAMFNNNVFYWAAVGDSSLYLYRNRELFPMNQKHIYANKLKAEYKAGEISREEQFSHPKRDRLTSYLGYEDFHEIDYSKTPIELKKEDKIIICSDGISDVISNIELENILEKKIHPIDTSEMILKLVLNKHRTNQDNATVIVLEKVK